MESRLRREIGKRLRRHRTLLFAALLALAIAGSVPSMNAVVVSALAVGLVLVAAFSPEAEPPGSEAPDMRPGPDAGIDLPGRALIDGFPEPMIVLSADAAVIHANPAAIRAFGPLRIGAPAFLRFRNPELAGYLRDVLGGKRRGAFEFAERVPFERWFQAISIPFDSRSGYTLFSFRDQSELRRIDKMRSDFIANASHELRTPLATVSGFIETLRGPARDDEAARERFLEIMQAQAERMARLIDDLLSLSRLETRPLDKTEAVELGAVIGAVIDALRPLAAEYGVEIEKKLHADQVEVSGSRDELFQVVQNILENALKYGRSGKRVIVELHPPDASSGGRVTIRDFGPGIPEEHIPRITERFYRIDVGASRAQKGTGLGLAIVKHIVTRHGAQLQISSTPGVETTFSVMFPVRRLDAA